MDESELDIWSEDDNLDQRIRIVDRIQIVLVLFKIKIKDGFRFYHDNQVGRIKTETETYD